MKKLFIALALVFSLGFGSVAQAEENIPTNFWAVQVFTPVVSESKQTLNVEYKVLSVYATDNKYAVKLLQNGSQIATHEINHAYGDSGVFSITLPAAGTYSYQINATITAESPRNGQSKSSEAVNIKVVDGTVTNTVPSTTTTSAADTNGSTNGSGAGQSNNSGSGKVTDKAANTSDKAGNSLGSKTTKATSDKKWYAIGAAVLLIGGAAYYWFVYRKAGELE